MLFFRVGYGWAEGHWWAFGGESTSQRAAEWAGPPDSNRTMARAGRATGLCCCIVISFTKIPTNNTALLFRIRMYVTLPCYIVLEHYTKCHVRIHAI